MRPLPCLQKRRKYGLLLRISKTFGFEGPEGLGCLVVSMTRSVADVSSLHRKEVGLNFFRTEMYSPLPVVPLFETFEDWRQPPVLWMIFFHIPVPVPASSKWVNMPLR